MNNRHIVEVLVEANKNISKAIDKIQKDNSQSSDHQPLINELNNIIRDLDHIVEHLEKNM